MTIKSKINYRSNLNLQERGKKQKHLISLNKKLVKIEKKQVRHKVMMKNLQ